MAPSSSVGDARHLSAAVSELRQFLRVLRRASRSSSLFNQLPNVGIQESLAGALQSYPVEENDDNDFWGTWVRGVSNPLSQRIEPVRIRESASCLEIEARIPSEVKAISPLVDRLIRLIEESRCVAGEELAVELALREALNNAVLHGNRLDPGKLVQVYCRCERGKELFVVVKDQGSGFDANEITDPSSDENLERDHGRGILLMRSQMDEISFAGGGTEVHMYKRATGSKAMPSGSAESDGVRSSNSPPSPASNKN